MLEELVGEGAEPGGESEEMIVIFKVRPWYAEEGLSRDKLKDKAAETPDINGIFDGSGKNQLGSSKAEWGNELCWRVGKEIRCLWQADVSIDIRYKGKKGTGNRDGRDWPPPKSDNLILKPLP